MADSQIEEGQACFPGANGDEIHAFFASPSVEVQRPAVIVVHGATGVSDDMKANALRFAREGYLVAVPDLYSRVESPDLSSLESAMKILGTMADDQVASDLEGAAEYLKAHPDCNGRVGAIGIGGRYGYLFASRTHSLDAAVTCYGPLMPTEIDTPELRPLPPIQMVDTFSCPLLGIFGGADQNPSPEHVAELEALMKTHGKDYEFHSYPHAGHGFLSEGGRNYQPEAAGAAWTDIMAWFKRKLEIS